MKDTALAQPGTLWDCDMGTGKTRPAIDLWEELGRPKTIITAPLSVVRGVWIDEFEKWRRKDLPPPRIGIVDSRIKARRGLTAAEHRIKVARESDVVITNYDLVWRKPFSDALLRMGFELLIMDEIHRIKAPGGTTSRYLSRLGDRVPKRVGLTGTPMPHSPLDIYAQFRALDKNVFGTSNALFKARYAIMGGYERHQVVGYQNEDELKSRFERIAVQVRADDVLTLPDSVDSTRSFELTPKAIKLYREAEREFYIQLEQGYITVANALVKLLRLQQITSGYLIPDDAEDPLTIDDGKRGVLKDILSDSGDTHVVVFCRFTYDVQAAKQVASDVGMTAWEFSGHVKQLDEWRDAGGVLAVQIQSGGLGIDLTKARTGIYYSLGFSLGDYLQSRARILRPGQTRKVHYIHILGDTCNPKVKGDSIDFTVMRALEKRQQVIESIIYRSGRGPDITQTLMAEATGDALSMFFDGERT